VGVLTVAVLNKIVLGEVAVLRRLDCRQNVSLYSNDAREPKCIRHRSVSPTKSPLFNLFSIRSRPRYSRRVILSPASERHRVTAPGHVHIGAEVVRAGLALRGVLDGAIDGGLLTGGNRNRIRRRPEHKGGQGQGKREAHVCSTSSESAVKLAEACTQCWSLIHAREAARFYTYEFRLPQLKRKKERKKTKSGTTPASPVLSADLPPHRLYSCMTPALAC
jgi:hypothetical protein